MNGRRNCFYPEIRSRAAANGKDEGRVFVGPRKVKVDSRVFRDSDEKAGSERFPVKRGRSVRVSGAPESNAVLSTLR